MPPYPTNVCVPPRPHPFHTHTPPSCDQGRLFQRLCEDVGSSRCFLQQKCATVILRYDASPSLSVLLLLGALTPTHVLHFLFPTSHRSNTWRKNVEETHLSKKEANYTPSDVHLVKKVLFIPSGQHILCWTNNFR